MTSHYFSKVWTPVLMASLFRPYVNVRFLVSYMIRTPRVFEGCFLDLRLLLLCIGVWPCRTVFVDFHVFGAAAAPYELYWWVVGVYMMGKDWLWACGMQRSQVQTPHFVLDGCYEVTE